jgi:MFS family permease
MTFQNAMSGASPQSTTQREAVYRRVAWRLVPLLFLCYIVAYLDRVNIGFAKLQMQSALQLSETVYGLGAGIFFVGYFIFEVPSNIVLHHVGARKWIGRIMITWGALSAGMMFVHSTPSFYVMRFLLGAAEAGFFPGIILYLTYWFPVERRAKVTSLFLAAIPASGIIGGPLSGWILKDMAGMAGIAGWQWLFFIQGLPTVLVGLLVFKYLDDRVSDATWLASDERDLIAQDIAGDNAKKSDAAVLSALASGRVWHLALVYFAFVSGMYGISFWLPSIIKSMGIADPLRIGLWSAAPWAFGVVAMYYTAGKADRDMKHRTCAAVAALVGATGLVASVMLHGNQWLAMAGLTVATMGIMSTFPTFWTLPTSLLGGTAAAAGIALINSFGNLSGFTAPFLIGLTLDATHRTDAGLYMLAGCLTIGAALLFAGRQLFRRAP